MQIIHSKATRMPDANTEEIAGLAGAILHEVNDDNKYPYWEVIPASGVDDLFNEDHADVVTGNFIEDIERELNTKYPCEYPGGTYIYRVDDWQRSLDMSYENTWARRKTHQYTHCDAFVVLPRPCITSPATIDELQDACDRLGPVLITDSVYERLGREYYKNNDQQALKDMGINSVTKLFEHLGFVTRERAIGDLKQVNHNPRAIALRKYNKQRDIVKERMGSFFPKEVLHDIGHFVKVDQWRENPYTGALNMGGPSSSESSGWGRGRKVTLSDFGIRFIRQSLEVARKLGGKKANGYWRKEGSSYERYNQTYKARGFNDALEAALPYIHGVEQANADRMKKIVKDCRAEHERKLSQFIAEAELDGGVTNPEDWFIDFDTFFTDMHDYRNSEWSMIQNHIWFCKWLRKEARACKIAIPKPPVMPTRPGKTNNRKRKAK